jgi:hypothetical protein
MKISDYIRGDTRVININALQADGITPLDLTGSKVYFTLNASNTPTDDTSAALQKTTITHIAPTLGQTSITINPTDTQTLIPQSYFYDIQILDTNGRVTSIKKDVFIINSDITRTNT